MRDKQKELRLILELMKAWCEDWNETYITGYYFNHDITYWTTDDGEEIPKENNGGSIWNGKEFGSDDRVESNIE